MMSTDRRSIHQRLALARSLLFVPGNRPERFDKAALSGADGIILDLEDGVSPADKAAARAAIEVQWTPLQSVGVPVVIRINALTSGWAEEDLAMIARIAPPAAVMVPKSESNQDLARVHNRLSGVPVLPLIESAAGYAALQSIGSAPGVLRLAFGNLDFAIDTGIQCDDDETELMPVRFAVTMTSRLNRLAPPIDGITAQFGDPERLRRDTQRAMRIGFGGKLCIHPTQVPVIHQVYMPTLDELSWAQKVVAADAAAGGAAVQVDGRMVDLPVVLQARRVLARAASHQTDPLSR